jgi:hypothetical protein
MCILLIKIIRRLFSSQTAKLLGFDNYIPPYANTNGDQLLTGVNFASAAAGIRDETGQQLVRLILISTLHLLTCSKKSLHLLRKTGNLLQAHAFRY